VVVVVVVVVVVGGRGELCHSMEKTNERASAFYSFALSTIYQSICPSVYLRPVRRQVCRVWSELLLHPRSPLTYFSPIPIVIIIIIIIIAD